jgi:hypothetical protein
MRRLLNCVAMEMHKHCAKMHKHGAALAKLAKTHFFNFLNLSGLGCQSRSPVVCAGGREFWDWQEETRPDASFSHEQAA